MTIKEKEETVMKLTTFQKTLDWERKQNIRR